jgi:uncharacterized lipoprotein
MRKFIPIIFVAVIALAGCSTPSTVHTQSAGGTNAAASLNITAGTNAVAGTNAAVAAAATGTSASTETAGHVNSPAETTSENVLLGDLGAGFLVMLIVVLGLKRS